jgi:hypothetical protein
VEVLLLESCDDDLDIIRADCADDADIDEDVAFVLDDLG